MTRALLVTVAVLAAAGCTAATADEPPHCRIVDNQGVTTQTRVVAGKVQIRPVIHAVRDCGNGPERAVGYGEWTAR